MVTGTTNDTTYYMGAFEYKNGQLNQIFTQEGRIRYDETTEDFIYDYYLQDHLGNNRVVFTTGSDGKAEVLQVNNYYPFGMRFNQAPQYQQEPNDYLYNGKEMQAFGLDWYDYGARMYDASLGRWHVVDPKAEEAYNWTPYRYAFNNPLRFIDPDGMLEADYFDEDGNFLASDGVDDYQVRVIQDEDLNNVNIEDRKIDAKEGQKNSVLATESNISDDAALNIVSNYDVTGVELFVENSNTEPFGMKTHTSVRGYKVSNVKVGVNISKLRKEEILNNSAEITSISFHESIHVNDKDFVNKSVREIRAYSAQRDHSSWVGTRPIFKRNVKNQLKKFWDKFFNGPIIDNKHGKIFK